MWKTLAIVMLCLLAACGGSGYPSDAPPPGGDSSGSIVTPANAGPPVSVPDATFSVTIANYDEIDYAMWIQWHDDQGAPQEDFLGLVPAAPPGSFTEIIQSWAAISGVPYELLLMDPSGGLVDSTGLGILGSGDYNSLSYLVVGGVLQLESVAH
jgi:hypothetical protein